MKTKTPQRNFVVEFKSGRRRSSTQPASIWGNTDLKALVRKAEKDAPHLFDPALGRDADHGSGERQHTTDVGPRILENASPADAQPVAKAPAETLSPGSAVVVIAPAVEPVLRPRVAAKRRVRSNSHDGGPKVAADRPGKAELSGGHEPDLAQEALDDLAILEKENQRLRSLLSDRLLQQNRQLRQMLLRFKPA